MEFDFLIVTDDDLFVQERKLKASALADWKPKSQDSQWYLSSEIKADEITPEETRIYTLLCQASCRYLNHEFLEASQLYRKVAESLPSSALKIHREAYEGLARTSVRLGEYSEALNAIQKLESLCKTSDQRAVCYALNAFYHHYRQDYHSEAFYIKLALLIHPYNPDLWIKLSESFASHHNIPLKETSDEFQKIREFKPPGIFKDWSFDKPSPDTAVPFTPAQLVAASLVRAGVIIYSTLSTATDLARERDFGKLRRISGALEGINVEEEFVAKAIRFYSLDVYRLENVNGVNQKEGDFRDIGSSAYVENEDVGHKDKENVDTFDKQWLSWL